MLMRQGEVVRRDADGAVIGLLPKFPYEQARVTVEPRTGLPCAEVVLRVLQAADEHIAGAPQHDDMTMVAVRF